MEEEDGPCQDLDSNVSFWRPVASSSLGSRSVLEAASP